MLIPSIDLMDGKAVQLRAGRERVLTSDRDPIELAEEFNRFGEVAVIDLDAAMEKGDNLALIKRMCRVADLRVGGGVRDLKRASELLRAGARKIIVGTAASPDFLSALPKSKVQVALDHINGCVLDQGWKHSTGEQLLERAARLAPYCSGFLCTFVKDEGGMQGMNPESVRAIKEHIDIPITVAGGVKDHVEAAALNRLGVDVQVGMALYTGRLDLSEAMIQSVDFEKSPLAPTVVRDEAGQVLMLAYSNRDSLRQALDSGRGVYFSRSRNELWIKGATSGNTQKLISCRLDCDESILFLVEIFTTLPTSRDPSF